MALNATYLLEFAGVPFCLDKGSTLPKDGGPSLAERLDRMLPCRQLRSYAAAPLFPGRTAAALAPPQFESPGPTPDVRIGEWHYPSAGRRWSVFRGLMTSLMVKQLLSVVGAGGTGTFTMKAKPDTPAARANDYTLSTTMMLLPPRPLAEHGGAFDGLYLVELVDERFDWQTQPLSLTVTRSTTWAELISAWAAAVNVSVSYSALSAAYGQPEPDSELFCRGESAALLIDAIAVNVGRALVRNLDGTYALLSPQESYARAQASRGVGTRVVRTAGGDLFASGVATKAGNLSLARNYVVPDTVTLSFPRYVWGPDPVPHALDPRPGTLYQRVGPGEHYQVSVPVRSGGVAVSGLTGAGGYVIQDTAKALYSGEADAAPFNASGLTALALQAAGDYYAAQALASLDEVYEGTYAWTPEGLHDVVWTYSHEAGGAKTRVMRQEWTARTKELQHAAPPLSGRTTLGLGFGGPPVALTVRDQNDGSAATQLSGAMTSGAATACLVSLTGLPTADRWKGFIGEEKVLFEAASGGFNVGVAARGIDDTAQEAHAAGAVVRRLFPTEAYGINLITLGTGLTAAPGAYTSGGLREVVITGTADAGTTHYEEDVGDGSASEFVVTHGLLTTDVVVVVYEIATGTVVYPEVSYTSSTEVTVDFGAEVPTLDQYRVVVSKAGSTGGGGSAVSGPTTSTDNGIATFDGTNGGTIQSTAVTVTGTDIAGASSLTFTGGGTVTGGTAAAGSLTLTATTSTTPGVVNVAAASSFTATAPDLIKTTLTTTGTPAAGLGSSFAYDVENSVGTTPTIARTTAEYTDPTDGSEDADYVIATMRAGAVTEQVRVTSLGAVQVNQIATPTTPPADKGAYYFGTDGKPYAIDDGDNIYTLASVTASVDSEVGFSAVASVSLTGLTGYRFYRIIGYDLQASTAGPGLWMRTSTDGGSSYDAGGADYRTFGSTAAQIVMGTLNQDTTDDHSAFDMILFNLAGTDNYKLAHWTISRSDTASVGQLAGVRLSTADIDAVQFLVSTGTFRGTILVYGYD
jgi:hypothetical protein